MTRIAAGLRDCLRTSPIFARMSGAVRSIALARAADHQADRAPPKAEENDRSPRQDKTEKKFGVKAKHGHDYND